MPDYTPAPDYYTPLTIYDMPLPPARPYDYINPGAPVPVIIYATFTILTVTPTTSYLELTFSDTLAPLTLSAAIAGNWVFSGGSVPVIVGAVSIVGSNVLRIYYSKPHAGDTYTLTLPINGLGSATTPYSGPPTINFVAVATGPYAQSCQFLDYYDCRVIFNEPVQTAEAIDLANWSISPALTIYAITQESQTTYKLRTSIQSSATTYLITIVNVRDFSNNQV
jgi:hypothetical protein